MTIHRIKKRPVPVLILILAVVTVSGYYVFRLPDLGTRESLNILIVGIDGVVTFETTPSAPPELAPTADAIALLSLHPRDRTAHLLLIPGELNVPPDRDDPLAAYLTGRPLFQLVDGIGAASLVDYIETTIDIPIHHVIRIDSLSLIQLVDRVDGLTLPVAGSDGIPGRTARFSGDEVYAMLRSAAASGESERLRVQTEVFEAGLAAIRSQRRLVHLSQLFQFVRRHLETELSEEHLFAVAKHLYEVDDSKISIEVLPGHFVDGEYSIDTDALGQLIRRTYKNKERPSGRSAS